MPQYHFFQTYEYQCQYFSHKKMKGQVLFPSLLVTNDGDLEKK